MRKQYSKSDIKRLLNSIKSADSIMTKKSQVYEDENILFVDNKPSFIRIDKTWIPHLKLILTHDELLPKVTVDKGAIKFVIKGADIMRPGITKIEEFEKGEFVTIVDENYNKPLAIGKTLLDSIEMTAQENGKSIANIHRIGDEFWEK